MFVWRGVGSWINFCIIASVGLFSSLQSFEKRNRGKERIVGTGMKSWFWPPLMSSFSSSSLVGRPSAGRLTSTGLRSVSQPATPSCPRLPALCSHSHSLVFTFSSQTSQDLPVIPLVPLLPGDRVGTTEPLPDSAVTPAAEHPLPAAAFGNAVKSRFSQVPAI